MDKEYDKVKGYLSLVAPFELKRFLWGMLGLINILNPLIFNFLNDLGLKQSIFQPKNIIFIVITIVFDCWGILILLDINRRQKQFILFSGLISLFLSTMYIEVFYDIIYLILEIKSITYILIVILVSILILISNFAFLMHAIANGYFSKENNRKEIGISFVLTFVSVGMIGEKLYSKFSDIRSQLVIVGMAVLLFGYCFLFTVHNIYKYYLIKKHKKC